MLAQNARLKLNFSNTTYYIYYLIKPIKKQD